MPSRPVEASAVTWNRRAESLPGGGELVFEEYQAGGHTSPETPGSGMHTLLGVLGPGSVFGQHSPFAKVVLRGGLPRPELGLLFFESAWI